MTDFSENYLTSPQGILDFLVSDDFCAFDDEIGKKFELGKEKRLNLNYLLQDLAIRSIEPDDPPALVSEIQKQLELPPEPANQIAHLIWTRFKPLIDKIWKEAGEKQVATEATPQAELAQLIEQIKRQEGPNRNVVDLTRVAKSSAPAMFRPPTTATSIPIKSENSGIIRADPPKPGSPLVARVISINTDAAPAPAPIGSDQQRPSPAAQPKPVIPVSTSPMPAVAPRPAPAPPQITNAPRPPMSPVIPPAPLKPIVPPAPPVITPKPFVPSASPRPPFDVARGKPAPLTPPMVLSATPPRPAMTSQPKPSFGATRDKSAPPTPPPSVPKQPPPTKKIPPSQDVIDLSHL